MEIETTVAFGLDDVMWTRTSTSATSGRGTSWGTSIWLYRTGAFIVVLQCCSVAVYPVGFYKLQVNMANVSYERDESSCYHSLSFMSPGCKHPIQL